MRINSIQNYDINNQNSKNHKNQSFKQLTITESELRNVKNLLNDKKTFERYYNHIKYLNGFTLNLKEIMKDVNVCDFLTFDEAFPHLKPEQINKVGQEVIQSFLDAVGEEKTKDFRLEIIPNSAESDAYQDYTDNEFEGTGISCGRLVDYYKNRSKITPDMIVDNTWFRPWTDYRADVYSYTDPYCSLSTKHLRLPDNEEELWKVVRGTVIQNMDFIISNRLKPMEEQAKQNKAIAEARKISNMVSELR